MNLLHSVERHSLWRPDAHDTTRPPTARFSAWHSTSMISWNAHTCICSRVCGRIAAVHLHYAAFAAILSQYDYTYYTIYTCIITSTLAHWSTLAFTLACTDTLSSAALRISLHCHRSQTTESRSLYVMVIDWWCAHSRSFANAGVLTVSVCLRCPVCLCVSCECVWLWLNKISHLETCGAMVREAACGVYHSPSYSAALHTQTDSYVYTTLFNKSWATIPGEHLFLAVWKHMSAFCTFSNILHLSARFENNRHKIEISVLICAHL